MVDFSIGILRKRSSSSCSLARISFYQSTGVIFALGHFLGHFLLIQRYWGVPFLHTTTSDSPTKKVGYNNDMFLYEVARCLAFVLYNYSAWYSVPRKPISSTISDKIELSKYMSLIYFISQISFLILHLKRKVIVCLIQAGRSVLITLFTDTITQSISLSQYVCPYISPRFWTNSSTGFKNGE
jgi:hypothetical protein